MKSHFHISGRNMSMQWPRVAKKLSLKFEVGQESWWRSREVWYGSQFWIAHAFLSPLRYNSKISKSCNHILLKKNQKPLPIKKAVCFNVQLLCILTSALFYRAKQGYMKVSKVQQLEVLWFSHSHLTRVRKTLPDMEVFVEKDAGEENWQLFEFTARLK